MLGPPPSPPDPDKLFEDGLIFVNEDNEQMCSIKFTPNELKEWRFLMSGRPHTAWFLATDFYEGTIYSVGKDGSVYDLRNQKVGSFTTSQLDATDEWIKVVRQLRGPLLQGPDSTLGGVPAPQVKVARSEEAQSSLAVAQVP